MFKSHSFSGVFILMILMVSACQQPKRSSNNGTAHTASNINPGKDTIKANLAARDKNMQALADGTVMNVANTIGDNLSKSKQYTTFMALIEKSSMYRALRQKGPYTVFAPSNEAFDKLGKATLDRLLSNAGSAERDKILKYHIIAGNIREADLSNGELLSTLEGDALTVTVDKGKITLENKKGGRADITTPDILNSNGIIHLVDGVIFPENTK